jgi:hypothetical protein
VLLLLHDFPDPGKPAGFRVQVPLGHKNCDFAIGLGAAAVGFLIGRLFHTT